MTGKWGRDETVIWPPQSPVYSYGAVFLALLCTVVYVWIGFVFVVPPLQHVYTAAYMRSGVGAMFHQHGTYRLLYVRGPGGKADQIARPEDVEHGVSTLSGGAELPLELSDASRMRGSQFLYVGPKLSYQDERFHAYLVRAIWEGEGFSAAYLWCLGGGAATLLLLLGFAIPRDVERRKVLKYGRRLKGPEMMFPKQFQKAVQGDGVGIKTTESGEFLRIPKSEEAKHIVIFGDTGAGKTAILLQILVQIRERGEGAIVYDPACEFVQRFYRPDIDIILNPFDERCPYWGPSEELRSKAEAKAIAESLYQPTSDKKGEFFTETPQKIFAHLLTFGPTPQQLVQWMSDPSEIDRRVAGTELAQIIAKGAQQQRSGVLASLGLIADSLRLLPTKEQADGKAFSVTEWSKTRKGWIFLTSKATERAALRPLQSLWIDLLVLRNLNEPTDQQRPVWFVLDELASLQRLPQLDTALTENRKSENPILILLQGKAQAEYIYGRKAEFMLSQPKTKLFLRTSEAGASEWISKMLGKVEIERIRETKFDGSRAGRNFTIDRQVEPLVLESEIAGLEDRHAFLKHVNHVVRFSFSYPEIPRVSPAFVPRSVEENELDFDPITLLPKKTAEQKPPQAAVSDKPEVPQNEEPLPQDEPPLPQDEKPEQAKTEVAHKKPSKRRFRPKPKPVEPEPKAEQGAPAEQEPPSGQTEREDESEYEINSFTSGGL